MAKKDREQRRAKRIAKQRKKRSSASRPALDGQRTGEGPSFKTGIGWPPGDCFASEGYDLPGAQVTTVFTRSHADGRTLAAIVEIDRRGPGVTEARVLTSPRSDAVLAECGEMSEARGVNFQGVPPAVIAGLIDDAREHGDAPTVEAWSKVAALIADLDRMEPDAPFGPAPEVEERPPGLLDRFFQFLG